MAITTGTTWDLLLDQSSAGPAPTSAADVSPRAAYQDALHGRAVLADVRTAHRSGLLPPALAPVSTGPDPAALLALADARAVPVLLVDDGGSGTARALAARDPRLVVVEGGVAGWETSGLPLVRLAPVPRRA